MLDQTPNYCNKLNIYNTDSERTVREFCEIAFSHADLDYRQYILQDEKFYRPAEVDLLISDPSKARTALKWQPTVSFKELVTMMVDADMARQLCSSLVIGATELHPLVHI